MTPCQFERHLVRFCNAAIIVSLSGTAVILWTRAALSLGNPPLGFALAVEAGVSAGERTKPVNVDAV
jgi:hypothetical protein